MSPILKARGELKNIANYGYIACPSPGSCSRDDVCKFYQLFWTIHICFQCLDFNALQMKRLKFQNCVLNSKILATVQHSKLLAPVRGSWLGTTGIRHWFSNYGPRPSSGLRKYSKVPQC